MTNRILLRAVASTLAWAPMLASTADLSVEDRLKALESIQQQMQSRQDQLEQMVRDRDTRIEQLERERAVVGAAPAPAAGGAGPALVPAPVAVAASAPEPELTIEAFNRMTDREKSQLTREQIAALQRESSQTGGILPATSAADPRKQGIAAQMTGWGSFAPGKGFTVAQTDYGELNISAYAQLRYVNQFAEDTWEDRNGNVNAYDERQDITLNKTLLWFTGWLADPKFRYNMSIWSSQGLQGLNGNIQFMGSLSYRFSDLVTLSGGIGALPGAHTNMGNWPLWLGTERSIGDDYFKPGYSQGVWVEGALAPRLFYKAMLGNNINAIGIDPGQFDAQMETVSGALWWMPSTGEWGPRNGAISDYEMHQTAATIFGVHYTHSREDRFAQLNGGFENSAIRLSDGLALFERGALAPGVSVKRVTYDSGTVKAGYKYQGFSVLGEWQWRNLSDFSADGAVPDDSIFEHGLVLHVSKQVVPQRWEVYGRGSYIWGDYRDPWDAALGVNFYPFQGNRQIRLNGDLAYIYKTPVGSPTYPWQIGMEGTAFNAALEVLF
jgi:hypothetical protein